MENPFTEKARLNETAFAELIPLAVRMLDNAIDVSRFPLPAQEEEARKKRRIGLGVTGLADALIFCGLRYGSAEAVETTRRWMRGLQRAAYAASASLAQEKGAFPLFDKEKYLAGESIKTLDSDIKAAIESHGIRNALVTSVAPTGTISLLANNVSSGIEPVFSFAQKRRVLGPDGTATQEDVQDFAYSVLPAPERRGRAAYPMPLSTPRP